MEHLLVPNEVLLGKDFVTKYLCEGKQTVITPKGCSMLPFIIGDHDSVCLQRQDELRVLDVVLALLENGSYVLHRVVRIEGEEVTLMGDGNIRGQERCKRRDIVGTVVSVIHPNGKETPFRTPSERRRAKCWIVLLPIRRYLLAIYKRTILKILSCT
ncbi:MAG: S24/S26 family peptidase [Bacteroidales bacterium]|nr:S24/S26 family peptidase [Bacteroidales bacterium]